MTRLDVTHTFTDARREGARYEPHWRACVGAGRAAEGLRASWLDSLRLVREHCGFERVRFHGLFHDDMGIYHAKSGGTERLTWLYLDDLFDRMLEIGVRPFIELGFCPRDLAGRTENCFWWKAHASPPWNPAGWERLIEGLARHLIARYGRAEVAGWQFEVWNEPNLKPFWHGTRARYFDLYARTARALKGVDADLRVGGPATSNFVPDARFAGEIENHGAHLCDTRDRAALEQATWTGVWIREFLDYCARERAPVDFISTHPYPTDWALDSHGQGSNHTRRRSSVAEDLRWLRQTIAASAFPNAPIHCTEWSSSPSNRDHMHDLLPPATYIAYANIQAIGLCESLSHWTFTDLIEEMGTVPGTFCGGFGLVNFMGLPKPAFHAYRFLNALGPRLVARAETHAITADDLGGVQVLAWNYPDDCPSAPPRVPERAAEAYAIEERGAPAPLRLALAGLRPGARVEAELIDREHGHGRRLWEAQGAPEPPDRAQTAALAAAAMRTAAGGTTVAADGTLTLDYTLPPWAVLLVRVAGI